MFYSCQTPNEQEKYQELLQVVASLSNLFSDSKAPYLYYRAAENIFCKAFNAENLSRSDVSADAKKDSIGIGLKTFLTGNNRTFQKVAEFNSDSPSYSSLSHIELIRKIANLRNSRINFTENTHDLNKSSYHCILRQEGIFKIFEEEMVKVDIPNIQNIRKRKTSITFDDGIHDYSFLLSKSTLTKRFTTSHSIFEFDVAILDDPLAELKYCLQKDNLLYSQNQETQQTIYLPLYGSNRKVYERSGLNQWNAKGRERHPDEVYIPIPIIIHQNYPEFFPDRDTPFQLKFPDGEFVTAKVCQENSKALMTQSNRKLGKLILRDGLGLKEGELVTYEKLQLFGIDYVRLDKTNNDKFELNFSKNNSYENFKKVNLI